MKEIILSKYIEQIFTTPDDSSRWFGYYNYDTLNSDQTLLLCNFIEKDGLEPRRGQKVTIGYYSLNDGIWHPVSETDSWNWQQGAMAQWLPDDRVIFNFSENNRIKSKIIETVSGDEKIIDYPIYGITPDGKTSIAIEMERSYWCRAYHYQSVVNEKMNTNILNGDGIFSIDLDTGIRKLIVPIEDIVSTDSNPDFYSMKHWVEHVMINQSGTKICFLHRFSPAYDVNLYQTRLFVCDIDGSNLQLIPGWANTDLSHFGWNGEEFAIYTVENNNVAAKYKSMGQNSASSDKTVNQRIFKLLAKIARLLPKSLRKVLKGGTSYYSYYSKDNSGVYRKSRKIGGGLLDIDGHPSFTNDGRYMITDTYPDSKGYQHLLIYDLETQKTLELARFNAYYHNTPASCDLHPKLCKNNDYVAVDTAYDKFHHTVLFKIDWPAIKKKLSQ